MPEVDFVVHMLKDKHNKLMLNLHFPLTVIKAASKELVSNSQH